MNYTNAVAVPRFSLAIALLFLFAACNQPSQPKLGLLQSQRVIDTAEGLAGEPTYSCDGPRCKIATCVRPKDAKAETRVV